MNMEALKERISNYKDIRRNLWAAIIVLSGGIAGLFISLDSVPKIVLFIAGLILDYVFIERVIYSNKKIESFLTELEEV